MSKSGKSTRVKRLRLPAEAILFVGLCACGDNALPPRPDSLWVERSLAGDTSVVRNFGVGTPSSYATLTKEITVTGGETPGSEFTIIVFAYPTIDGGAVVAGGPQADVRLFDSTGKFVRSYGREGEGPGEFRNTFGMAIDARGFLFVQRLPWAVVVFDTLAKLAAQWEIPESPQQWYVTTDGDVFVPKSTPIRDSVTGRATEAFAVLHYDKAGKAKDSIPIFPQEFGPRNSVTLSTEFGRDRYDLPLSPQFRRTFGPPGVWAYGNSSSNEFHILNLKGQILRIVSDDPVTIPGADERAALAALATAEFRSMDRAARVEVSQIPSRKPFFKNLRLDVEGRLWVEISQPGRKTTRFGCPPSFQFSAGGASGACDDGAPQRNVDEWVEPTVYDVFDSTGEHLFRVALPEQSRFMAARGSHLWLRFGNFRSGESLVRFRIQFPRSP